MKIEDTTGTDKMTIVPLSWVDDGLPLPTMLVDAVSIENVTGLVRAQHFELWREHLSKRDRDDLSATRVALVHRFTSSEFAGMNEQKSIQLLYKIFIAFRVVRPTRTRFASIQYRTVATGDLDLFSFSQPSSLPVYTPDAEALNRVSFKDLIVLQRILPKFLEVSENGPDYLQRAVRYYEAAYSQINDPVIQFITWAMGIEAAVASSKPALRRSELLQRVYEKVGGSTPIYGESPMSAFLEMPNVTVNEVLPAILTLRSRVAHGWPWPDWKSEVGRSALTGEKLSYPEVLREAAPFVLRKLIINALVGDESNSF